jgi:hypothetical protein
VVVLLLFACPRTRAWVPVALSLVCPDPSGACVSGQPFRAEHPGDALVVVSVGALRRAAEDGDFSQTLWSYAWAGLLEQELGAPSVRDLEELSPDHLGQARLIVFTRSATCREPEPEVLSAVDKALGKGAAVLLEMPSAAWSEVSGVVFSPGPINPTGSFWRGRLLEFQDFPGTLQAAPAGSSLRELLEMPAFTWLAQCVQSHPSVRPLGRLSGKPLLYVRPRGRGQVLTLGFDLACQVQALQQGVPGGPGFAVPEARGLIPGLSESQDLVLDSGLLDNCVPYADLLEGWILDMAEQAAGPLPGWWRFPFDHDGVAVLSYDEEGRGREAFGGLEALQTRWGIPSTVFALAGRDLPERWPEGADDLELHWNRFLAGNFPPYERPDLRTQVARLQAVRGTPPRLNRTHFLAWGREYSEPFRQMAAAGLELDSTYGPNRGRGYLFGTGLPFRVLDQDGLPLPLWEWPFVSQEDWAGADQAFLLGLLDDSARAWHQAPVLLLHPHRLVATAEGKGLVEAFVQRARQRRHLLTTMLGYHDFLRMRARARMQSRLQGEVLKADLFAPGPGLAVHLPATLKEVQIDGEPARTRWIRLYDCPRLLVEIPPGQHRLLARPTR